MILIDLAIIFALLIFLVTAIYDAYLTKKDKFAAMLYDKERQYSDYLYKQLLEKEQIIKNLQDEISKISAANKDI